MLHALPLARTRLRSTVTLASASRLARAIEPLLPARLLLGAFLVASAEKSG